MILLPDELRMLADLIEKDEAEAEFYVTAEDSGDRLGKDFYDGRDRYIVKQFCTRTYQIYVKTYTPWRRDERPIGML